jgi:hypothetical protein
MSYASTVEAIPGLVALWMGTDTTGSSVTDQSGNGHTLALGVGGALNGAAIIPEAAVALSCVGGATVAASVAVLSSSPLVPSVSATSFTFCGFAQITTDASTGWLGGINLLYEVRQAGASGTLEAVVWVGGAAHTIVGRTALGTSPFFWALTYDGNDILFAINGNIEGRLTVPGTITATSGTFSIGLAGDNLTGTAQGFAFFSRALSLGELRKLLRAGDSAHTIEQIATGTVLDLVSDGNTAVAAQSQTRFCGYCGGLMRQYERGASGAGPTGQDSLHPTCHAVSLRTPVLITSGNMSYANFATQAMHLLREYTIAMSKRTGPARPYYNDGTIFQGFGSGGWWASSWIGSAAATLARYEPGKRSPWNAIVRQQMASLISNMLPNGSMSNNPIATDANGFTQVAMGFMVLMTKNTVEKTTWNTWRDAFIKSCYFELNGTGTPGVVLPFNGTGGGGSSDATYYINGNRNLLICLMFYIAYLVTGNSFWDTQYEAELSFTIAPPAGSEGSGPGGSATGFGLFDGTTNAAIAESAIVGLNPQTQLGYLAESNGTVTGVDWDYLQLQLDFAHLLWLISGDARIQMLTSIFRNMLQSRLTRSTWVLNATGGSRHSLNTAWLTTAEISLVYKGGRTDIGTLADLYSFWTLAAGGLEANWRSQGMTGNVAYCRDAMSQLAALLIGQADFPGIPK